MNGTEKRCRVIDEGEVDAPWTILSPEGFRLGYCHDQKYAQKWAAAPELLEVCEGLIEALQDECGISLQDAGDRTRAAVEKARAAIAKAEGGAR